jgi:DNA-binding MarR family transcriptional regulator
MTRVDRAVVAAVESLMFASIGVTSRTIAATPIAADLTLSQWRLLALVCRADAPMRLGALAADAGMSMPSASRMLARLITRDLVRSITEPDDRRAVRIEPTARGRHVVDEVIERRGRLIARAVDRTKPPAGFTEQLDRLVAALVEEDVHEDRSRCATDGGDPAGPLRGHGTHRRGPRRRAVVPRA